MNHKKRIRFATIGTNTIVDKFLEAAREVEEFELCAVYSRKEESAKAFLDKNGISEEEVKIFTSIDALANDKEVDAVYIASPTAFHFEQTNKMLQCGKHVLCEKPLFSNSHQLEQNMKSAKANNVILLEAMRSLYSPGFLVIKQALDQLGEIRLINLSYCQYSSRYDKFKQGIVENAFKPELSNGALMDIGVYCIAYMVGLFGKPESIQASGYIIPNSIDGFGHIIAKYQTMQASLTYSKVCDSESYCEIQGEKGTLYFDQVGCPGHVFIKYCNGETQTLMKEQINQDIKYEIEAFITMIKGSLSVANSHEISSVTMEVLDEARKQIGIKFPADNM